MWSCPRCDQAFKDGSSPLLSSAISLPKLEESDQVNFLVELAAQKADQLAAGTPVGACIRALKPFLNIALSIIYFCAPLYIALYTWCWECYRRLPKNASQMAFGAALCFFGGGYFAVFAAVEAFRTMGFNRFRADVEVISAEIRLVLEAHERDDQLDADADGVKDVKQASLTPHFLVTRQFLLIWHPPPPPFREASFPPICFSICRSPFCPFVTANPPP